MPIILSFCIPLLLGNVFQQFYNMADSIIVGRFIGVDAFASVGSTTAVNFLVIGFVLGLCNGFCIPIAQSFGAGDLSGLRRFLANAFYLSVGFTILLTAITMIFTRQILVIMDTPEDIINGAYSYIIVIFAGIAAIMAYNLLASLLRALGDSRTPLIFLAVACVINVVLDLVFVAVLKMGVEGTAYATVISQAVSAILCYSHIRKHFHILAFEKQELEFSWQHSKKLLGIGFPMALQFSITAIGSVILQTAVNRLGTDLVAAVTAGNRISMLMFVPLETLGITMATYCGQNTGAKKLNRVKKGILAALALMLIYCVIAGLTLWFLSGYIAQIFIKKEEVEIIKNAVIFLRFCGICYPLLGVLMVFRNSVQGMGFSIMPMFAGLSELAARGLIGMFLVGVWGFTAVCLAAPTAWLLADFILIPTYFMSIKKLKRVFRSE
ncbi:MAG: MATE family efflux transporter [Eubacterium sp.]|nr:MATE family efflux transporter [Eubacterium sp.]